MGCLKRDCNDMGTLMAALVKYADSDSTKDPASDKEKTGKGKKNGNCRGIVTSDVLMKGLSCGAIATRKLEGVNRDKGHERFILVRPLTVKVRPTYSWVGIDVSLTGERDTLCPALDELFLALSRQ